MVMLRYRQPLQPTQSGNVPTSRTSLLSPQRPQIALHPQISNQMGTPVGTHANISSHIIKQTPRNNSPLASSTNRVVLIAPTRTTNPQTTSSVTGNPQMVQLFKGPQNIKTNFIQKQ